MRVLLAHNRYRIAGGEERHLDLLQAGLRAAGADVARFEVSSTEPGSTLARARVAAGMIYRSSTARAIARAMDDFRPDIVHAHNILPLLSPSVLVEAHKRAKVVMTVHNHRLVCPAGTLVRRGHVHDDCVTGSSLVCGLRGARTPWAESIAYGLAIEIHRRLRLVERSVDAFVTPSEALAAVLLKAGLPPDRIHVIPHGVPIEPWRQRERTHGLFAGRLSPEKGIATLLEAMRIVPEVPVYVAGDGPLASTVAGLGAQYIGRLPQDELAAWQRRAAFVLAPSECPENLPFAALESLATGTPVIAAASGGLTEIVSSRESGRLVPPGDPGALAAAMRELWAQSQTDPDYGRGAWESAKARYEMSSQTAKVAALYDEVRRRP
jgi:glycosyltransferase involved in cell wall biosynthesis